MKIDEIRGKKDDELRDELLALRREQFNLRMQKGTGQFARNDQFSRVRKSIARIKTVLGERTRRMNADV
ncbi:MAG: 50S ribosomal protein L29 [Pseudomonadota bacterium]|nr:50S ribosomal protein L29 [Pseudomonadota bacterium]